MRLAEALILSNSRLYSADAQPRQQDGENFPNVSNRLPSRGVDAVQLRHQGLSFLRMGMTW